MNVASCRGGCPGPPLLGIELKEFGDGASADKNLMRAVFRCIVDFLPGWPANGRP